MACLPRHSGLPLPFCVQRRSRLPPPLGVRRRVEGGDGLAELVLVDRAVAVLVPLAEDVDHAAEHLAVAQRRLQRQRHLRHKTQVI